MIARVAQSKINGGMVWAKIMIPILVAALLGLNAWQFNGAVAQAKTDTRQDEKITSINDRLDRMDQKLDRILDKLD